MRAESLLTTAKSRPLPQIDGCMFLSRMTIQSSRHVLVSQDSDKPIQKDVSAKLYMHHLISLLPSIGENAFPLPQCCF